MVGPLPKAFLFLSSYLPLWLVLAVVNCKQLGVGVVVPIVLAVLGAIGIVWLVREVRTTAPTPLTVGRVERNDLESVTYVLTYLFPFVGNLLGDQSTAIDLAILFVFVLAVYVRADLFYINPVLVLLGWHVYRVEDSEENELVLLAGPKPLKKGAELRVVPLSDGVWREKTVGDSSDGV